MALQEFAQALLVQILEKLLKKSQTSNLRHLLLFLTEMRKCYRQKLSLADSISVHDDSVRLETSGGLVEHHQVLFNHGGQFLNHFHTMSLNTNCGCVARWVSILTACNVNKTV